MEERLLVSVALQFCCQLLKMLPYNKKKASRKGPFNPYLTNGFSHHYHSGQSTFIFRGVKSDFYFFYLIFDEISLCKQNSPRWDAAFCGVTSGAILFAYVTEKGRQA